MKRTVSARKRSSASATWTRRMRAGHRAKASFAICVDNLEYPVSLERHKVYRVLPDPDARRDGDLRVVDESGEDYLFSADRFVAIEVPAAVKNSLLKRA